MIDSKPASNKLNVILTEEQSLVVTITLGQLNLHLAGKNPAQLLLKIPGDPDVGKSKVIAAIQDSYAQCGATEQLGCGAFSGVTSANILGHTPLTF